MRMLPVVFRWRQVDLVDEDGVATKTWAMVPDRRYAKIAGRQFHEDGEYPLVIQEARAAASHNHFFAAIKDGFDNLPENISARFPSPEHLRKWCLIETGWCDEREEEFVSEKYAKRFAAFFRDDVDEYARIRVIGTKVYIRRAKSQDHQHMDKETFEASKKSVLEMISSLIGIKSSDLKKNAGRAA